jgi:mono/diheme cytochrome c family protein
VRVVFTCERHAAQGARKLLDQPERAVFGGGKQDAAAATDDMRTAIIPLTCIGMAHPDLAGRALAAGAAEVQFVGCPPEDCANREGNLWMEQRLERKRLPKLRRDVARAAIHTEWDAPNEFRRAIAGESPPSPATTYGLRVTRASLRSLVPALLLLAAVLAVTIALTGVSYRPASASQAAIRIDLRHRSGFPVIATETDVIADVTPDLADVAPPRLVVEIDGQAVLDRTYPWRGGDAQKPVQALEQIGLPPGDHQLRVLVFDQAGQSEPQVVVDQAVALEAGQILPLQLKDVRLGGDTSAGERLFKGETLGTNTGCQVCHSLEPGVRLVGPSLAGVAARAETSVPGLSAKEYLRQSIVEPSAYVVESFPANQMPPNFAETLTEQQIADIVEFLLTLR